MFRNKWNGIAARTFIEPFLSTKHHTEYSLLLSVTIVISVYESGHRFKWVNGIPNLMELDEWWLSLGPHFYILILRHPQYAGAKPFKATRAEEMYNIDHTASLLLKAVRRMTIPKPCPYGF